MQAVNIPEVVAEVNEVFDRYERALVENDVATLIELFWASPHTVRYGLGENLYGIEEIAAFRRGRRIEDVPGGDIGRAYRRRVVTTYGRENATVNIEFVRRASGRAGRQSQTWVRTGEPGHHGWRVVAAHVSFLDSTAR